MKSRQEIKSLAKDAMREQRVSAILIPVLVALVGGTAGSLGFFLGLIPVIGWLISLGITFLVMVLSVNVCGSFAMIFRRETVTPGDPFTAIPVNFVRKVGGMYWMSLWIFLWSLLFVIPGVIKSLAYSMTPYILAECPNVTATQALKVSMRMTSGHKLKLFILQLSWIGWAMLVPLTFGILGIVYVFPYMSTTMAGFYVEMRDEAIATGRISSSELA